jgi:hypothetical protein
MQKILGKWRFAAVSFCLDTLGMTAPYFFHFTQFKAANESELPIEEKETNCEIAVFSLERMHFADGPSNERSGAHPSARLVAWQKWAIGKGYVPADWSSRVGAPD